MPNFPHCLRSRRALFSSFASGATDSSGGSPLFESSKFLREKAQAVGKAPERTPETATGKERARDPCVPLGHPQESAAPLATHAGGERSTAGEPKQRSESPKQCCLLLGFQLLQGRRLQVFLLHA